jgi:hypothetical protein
MLLLGLYFFFYRGGFWQVDRATMAPLFDIMPRHMPCFPSSRMKSPACAISVCR